MDINTIVKPGELRGTGIIRDKDGNIKGKIEFSSAVEPCDGVTQAEANKAAQEVAEAFQAPTPPAL